MPSLRHPFRTIVLGLACTGLLSTTAAFAAPVDELASCGKRISEGVQKYTQNYTTGLGNCYLANDSLVFPIDCREDQRTKGIIGSAREKLATATEKCTVQGLDLLCPFEQKLPGDLYDWLVLDPISYETKVDALLDSIFRTTHSPTCPRPAGTISRAGIDCGRTLSGQLPKALSQIQQCIAKCEIAVTKNGGEPCVDFGTGEVKDAKAIDCIGRVRERLLSVLASRCTDATVVELGCPLAATSESAMVAALEGQMASFTTELSRDLFHAACRTYIPVGLVPTTATATLLPSGTPVEIHCGQTLDAAFFGADVQLLLTQDLDCADAGATDGLVIAAPGVQLNLGDSFRISGPRRASERTGVGVRIASGATNVLVNRGLVQKFGIGIADTDASCADATLREVQVRDNAAEGIVMKGLRARLDTLSVKSNGGDGIVLDASNGTLTASTCEDNAGSGAVVNGFDNEIESNSFGNLRDRGNAGHGLVVTGAGNRVYSNYAAVNGGDGLRILAATSPIFDSNTAAGNGGVGIRLASAGSQVESNRSEKNGDFEYEIAAGNTDLGNNRSNGATFAFPPAGGSYE